MEIKLDAEAVAGIASAAIFDSLSQEMRDSVIKQAIQGLMTPDKNQYGRGKTPLQEAFDSAISNAAFRVITDKITNDPQVEAAILELLGPLLTSALETEAKEWNSSLADTLGKALGTWLSEVARKNGER